MKKELRFFLLFLFFFVSLILQTTIIPFFQVGGVIPNLLLVLIIFTALYYGSGVGGAVGFTVGLIQDLLVGRYFGLLALSGLVTGYLTGYLEGKVYKENPLVPLLLVFSGSLCASLVFITARSLIGSFSFSLPLVWRDLIPGAFYNTLLAVFLFRPFTWLVNPRPSPGVDPVHMYLDYRG
ncbi:MAG: rod shape-determining protein MreD [Bacillota bacterium]|nr:rod shape-determining protein MreD [Bacillota bacterium]